MLGLTAGASRVRDLGALGLLAATCLLLRVPSLDRIALNPDESQYEATAAYLLGSGESAFLLPYTTAGTLALFEATARVCGPYSMVPIRVLVLAICFGGALVLYRVVAATGSRLGGLAAGLVFLHYSIPFEGHTANREWFAGIALLACMGLVTHVLRGDTARPGALLALAGAAAGVALWFKIQASFMTLAAPALLLWLGLAERDLPRRLRQVACYAAGGLVATALYCLQFYRAGTLGEFAGFLVPGLSDYVLANQAAARAAAGGELELLALRFFGGLPFRPLLVVAYGAAALWLVVAARNALTRRPPRAATPHPDVVLLFVFYLLAALASIKLGSRFFEHYYLFLVPPVAALLGFTLVLFHPGRAEDPPARVAGYGTIGLLLLERTVALGGLSFAALLARPLVLAPTLVHLAILLVLAAMALAIPRRLRAAAALSIALEVAVLVLAVQRMPPPPSLPHHPGGFEALVRQLDARAAPEDRLFVWGWLPELYSLTRMEPASVLTITQYVVNDDVSRPAEPRLNRPMADLLMRDLRRRPPRFVVDAWRRSWTMVEGNDPWLYRLELYPELELRAWLESGYDRVGTYDGCELYVRRPD